MAESYDRLAKHKAQIMSRVKAEAARRILEQLDERMAERGEMSPLDDYHGNHKLIVDILNEVSL